MTTGRVKKAEPCMALDKAQALFDAGTTVLKQAHTLISQLEAKGEDVTILEEKLKEGDAGERLAQRMLKHAMENSQPSTDKE